MNWMNQESANKSNRKLIRKIRNLFYQNNRKVPNEKALTLPKTEAKRFSN